MVERKMPSRAICRTAAFFLVAALVPVGISKDAAAAEPLSFAGSCDVTNALGYCMEYRGAKWGRSDAKGDCATAPGGVFRAAACPSAKRVATCSFLPRGTESSEIVYVYFAPMEIAAAKLSCPGTFTPAR